VAAAQGEIIHADDPRNRPPLHWQTPEQAQGGTPRHLHGQDTGETGSRTPTQLPCHCGYLVRQSLRPALMTFHQARDLLVETLPSAAQNRADQPPHMQAYEHPATVHRHIRHRPSVLRMHLRRRCPAQRAGHWIISGACRDQHRIDAIRHILDAHRREPENGVATRESTSSTSDDHRRTPSVTTDYATDPVQQR
jgi:hypothetical protein